MTSPDAIQVAFRRFGREAGFKSKSATLYRARHGVTAGVNLQKSQYGPQYYINVGFWLHSAETDGFVPEPKWNLRMRIETVLPHCESRLKLLLDLEFAMSDSEREAEVYGLLGRNLLSLVDPIRSSRNLREALESGVFPISHLNGRGFEALDLPIS